MFSKVDASRTLTHTELDADELTTHSSSISSTNVASLQSPRDRSPSVLSSNEFERNPPVSVKATKTLNENHELKNLDHNFELKSAEAVKTQENEEREYLSGIKLILVVIGLTLVIFLVLLDTSILATVSISPCVLPLSVYSSLIMWTILRLFQRSPLIFIRSKIWDGMEARIRSLGTPCP